MFSLFFIDRPRFALVISIVIMIAGLISIFILPVAQYPNITPPQISITTKYPGADASTVLKSVVQPIETQVNGVESMIYVSSTSADDGSANITVSFEIGTDGDMNTVNVQNRVNWAVSQLPQEVQRQGIIVKEKSSNMLLVITLSSPNGTNNSLTLSNYASIYVNDEIKRIPGVGDTSQLGELKYAMRIWLDPDKLASLKMTVGDVTDAIKRQNVQVAAGSIGASPINENQVYRYTIQTQGRLTSVEEFKSIIIRGSPTGANVKIKDVAKVELGSENYDSTGQLNKKPSALLAVYQLSDANGLAISQACHAKMEELKRSFPSDLEYGIQYDSTNFIQASIDEVVTTLYIAVFLVILVTWLFLQDVRSTLIPTVAIPVSLIGTFACLLIAGYSINLITLFGLILAIGIVVDDAIVVIENTNRLLDEGMSPKDAAKQTMKEVSGPVIATTLVLLAMFIPICFMPGITGELYRQFGVTISVAVSISSLNALTLSPALCGAILRKKDPAKKPFFVFRVIFSSFNAVFDKITASYSVIVTYLVRKAVLVLIAYIILMCGSLELYRQLPTGFIPEEDQGAFFVNIQLPDGAALPRTQRVIDKTSDILLKTPGVKWAMTCTGFNILTGTTNSNCGLAIVILDDWSKRKTPELKQDAIIRQVRKKCSTIPEAIVMPFSIPTIPGLGSTGGFSFVLEDTTGIDPQRLAVVADLIITEANKDPALSSVFTTFRAEVPRIYLNIDRQKALKLGVSISDINSALQGLMGYSYVNDFNLYGKVYKVEIQAEQKYRTSIDDISGLYVRNDQNMMVPLDTLGSISSKFGPQYLNRYNLYSSLTINGSPAPGFSSGQAMLAMERIARGKLPPGMKFEWTDMSYQEKLAGNKVIYVFALALLFIYLFLVAQYESWMIPLAVMLSVPVAFVGALLFLMIAGLDNNIYTQVGFVLLFGLATKTAILIVEFAKKQHDEEGKSIVEAATYAAKLRFRAVCMTALSFVLGTFPLVIADGAGAMSRKSLGNAVFGGMLASIIFGTLLIPAFYVIIQWLIDRGQKKKNIPETID
jgi:multidrug efflux pump